MTASEFVKEIENEYRIGLLKAVYKSKSSFMNINKNTIFRIDFKHEHFILNSPPYFNNKSNLSYFKVSGFDEAVRFVNTLTDSEDNEIKCLQIFSTSFFNANKSNYTFYIETQLFQGIQL